MGCSTTFFSSTYSSVSELETESMTLACLLPPADFVCVGADSLPGSVGWYLVGMVSCYSFLCILLITLSIDDLGFFSV